MLHAATTGAAGGYAVGGPVGAAVGFVGAPIAGRILKGVADKSTMNKVDAFREMVRGRSPLAESLPDRVAGKVSPRQALTVRALLLGSHPLQKEQR